MVTRKKWFKWHYDNFDKLSVNFEGNKVIMPAITKSELKAIIEYQEKEDK